MRTPIPAIDSRDRRIEIKPTVRIILILQIPQLVLSPVRIPKQLLDRLIAVGIVDISPNIGQPTTLVQDLTELITQLLSLGVNRGVGGSVLDKRGGKDVLTAPGKGSRALVDGVHTFHGVTLEHKDGAVEGGVTADGVGVGRVCARLSGDVVLLQVDWETGVGEADVLTRGLVESDAGPGGEVLVCA